jgi:Na+-driven multidrug efflux pump
LNVALISTSVLFLFPDTIAAMFANAEDANLLAHSADAIRIFCFAYLFRWFAVMAQSFLSAIEKPLQATILSVAVAFVFPVLLLGALWSFELPGIWFNFVGVNFLAVLLGAFLLFRVSKEIKTRELDLKIEAKNEKI